MIPGTLMICFQNISVIQTAKNQSIQNPASVFEPRIKLTDNRKILVNDVMTDNCTCVFKPFNTANNRLFIPFVVIAKGLVSFQIMDDQTVDTGNIIQ